MLPHPRYNAVPQPLICVSCAAARTAALSIGALPQQIYNPFPQPTYYATPLHNNHEYYDLEEGKFEVIEYEIAEEYLSESQGFTFE